MIYNIAPFVDLPPPRPPAPPRPHVQELLMKVAIVESDESSPLLRDALTDIFRRYGRKDEAPSWSGGNKRQHTMGIDELLSYLGRCGSAKDPLKQAETILHGHASVGRGENATLGFPFTFSVTR